MLIDEYGDYLKKCNLSNATVVIYSGRIRIFLNKGYSDCDLLGAVDKLILKYSKGGDSYDVKDRGNTAAALRKLKEYKVEAYVKRFFIEYVKGFSSFVPKSKYVSAYAIKDGSITITYSKGYSAVKTVRKDISTKRYCELIGIVLNGRHLLCPSNTAIKGNHGYEFFYNYFLDDNSIGNNCIALFDRVPGADNVRREFLLWLEGYIKS